MTEHRHPADRIALLVANSLARVQSAQVAGERGETFASENAAFTWLSAGDLAAA